MDTNEEYCCSTMLIVTGTDLDPDRVTQILGLTPTQTWRRGEHRRFERADGSVQQFASVHENGGWKCSLWDDPHTALHEQINHAVSVLACRAVALAELRAAGFDVELNCSEGSSGSSCLSLQHSLLKELVELSVDVDITVYR